MATMEHQDEDDRIKEAFLDMLNQACADWEPPKWDDAQKKYVSEAKFKGYDSMCLSAYEGALSLAVELGWIKKEEVLR